MSLVRPIPKYSSSSWSPQSDCDLNCLEPVLKNATHFVCNNYKTTTISSKLGKALGWDTVGICSLMELCQGTH